MSYKPRTLFRILEDTNRNELFLPHTPQDRIVSICWSLYAADGDEVTTVHHII